MTEDVSPAPRGAVTSRHAAGRPAGRLHVPPAFTAGLLASPLAWALHQQIGYVVASIRCPESSTLFHVVTVVMLLTVAAGAWLMWNARPAPEDPDPGAGHEVEGLGRFMLVLGLAAAAFFGTAIVAQGLTPIFFVEPCP